MCLGCLGARVCFGDFEHEGEPLLCVGVEGHCNAFGSRGHLSICHLI